MSRSAIPALPASYVLLRILIVLNIIGGVLITALLVASFTAEPLLLRGLGMLPPDQRAAPIVAMRAVMLIGIVGVPLVHVLLTRLVAIVRTVSQGDPFILANAARLRACAWVVLGLELLHLAVGAIYSTMPFKLSWSFSPTGLLAVLLLFVVAQVFAQGAAMRDDLEGTV
jgi:hypothetical protein